MLDILNEAGGTVPLLFLAFISQQEQHAQCTPTAPPPSMRSAAGCLFAAQLAQVLVCMATTTQEGPIDPRQASFDAAYASSTEGIAVNKLFGMVVGALHAAGMQKVVREHTDAGCSSRLQPVSSQADQISVGAVMIRLEICIR